jgi:hypothetical protein
LDQASVPQWGIMNLKAKKPKVVLGTVLYKILKGVVFIRTLKEVCHFCTFLKKKFIAKIFKKNYHLWS